MSAKARSSVSSSSARSSSDDDRHGELDAVVEVARHQVGGGDVDRVLAVALEGVDARVLEQPPDDRDDADVLRDAGHAWAQAADAAHVEVDLHAGLRGAVERADAAAVDERVHLHRDPRRRVGASAPRSCARSRSMIPSRSWFGRHQHLAVVQRAPVAGQVVEHVGDVGADLLVGREQAEVGVQARRRGVVVAGADVHVVAHAVALAAHDEHALGVRLQRRLAVDDVHAGLLHRLRPVDVHALVEARLAARRARPPACRARSRRSAPARAASRRSCGRRSA